MWIKSFKAALIGILFKLILSSCTPIPVASPTIAPTATPEAPVVGVTRQPTAPLPTATPTAVAPTATATVGAIAPRPIRTEIVLPGLVPPKVTPAAPTPTPGSLIPTTLKVEERARIDLAKRLGVAEDTIQVIRVLTDEMPMDRLLCDDPKLKGTPVTRPAFVIATEIKLKVYDKTYTYYAHRSRLVYCP